MYTPSPVDILILSTARKGELEKLKVIKKRVGDEKFRKRCDLVKDGDDGERVLHYAAQMGHLKMCEFLIEEVKVEINIKNAKGETPLLYAVLGRRLYTIKYLIDQGADIALSNSQGFTCLHYAATHNDSIWPVTHSKAIMRFLLMKGADIEANSVCGTPLQCAALSGSVETVQLLLDHGAKPNSVCLLAGSPLISAIVSHSSECVKLLLKAGAHPNTSAFGLKPLPHADMEGGKKSLNSLPAAGVDLNSVIAAGADPDKSLYGFSPLAHAAAEGETEILNSLLAAGANPNSLGPYFLRPIEHAASAQHHDCVRILLPVTRRIPNYPDWSADGIMEYCHSKEAKIKREEMRIVYLNLVEQKGRDAWMTEDYPSAVKWYSEATYLDPSNAKWLSNRSLCWERLGEAAFALRDALKCVDLEPEWAKAHYREGSAWKLLRNYHMSVLAFGRAERLHPTNDEIKKAKREALSDLLRDIAIKYPLEAMSIAASEGLTEFSVTSVVSALGKFYP